MKNSFLLHLGLKVGHFSDTVDLTGVTVFLIEQGAQIGIDIRGSATGSYNTHAYGAMTSQLQHVHAIVFSGGSSFGMESFFGVMAYLHNHKIGNKFNSEYIPGVTGAVIYDRQIGKPVHPTKADGYTAALNASFKIPLQGSVGAGTGATVGKWLHGRKMKGGFGLAKEMLGEYIVSAFVVTNAYGDCVNPQTGLWYVDAGAFPYSLRGANSQLETALSNTTLVLVATDLPLTRPMLTKIASDCQDALSRSIFPVHTNWDGDIVFAISTADETKYSKAMPNPELQNKVSYVAQQAVCEAIKVSLKTARGTTSYPTYQEKTFNNS